MKENVTRTWLLGTGMLAVLIYLLHVLIGGFLWPGYSHLHQPISDLTGNGAPHRAFLLIMTNLYGLLSLIFAFTFTIGESKKFRQPTFWGGVSLICMHFLSISYGLFPEDLTGSGSTFEGKMHLVVTGLIVPFTILAPILIGTGMKKCPVKIPYRSFGNFSLLCGILIFILGGLSGYLFTKRLPYFGIVERLNIGTLQLWTFLLSYQLTFRNR